MGLLWLVSLVAGVHTLSLEVDPDSPCVALASLRARLERAGLTTTGGDFLVQVKSAGRRLRVTARRGPLALHREVPIDDQDCVAIERLVSALILSWAKDRTELPPPATPPRRQPVATQAAEEAPTDSPRLAPAADTVEEEAVTPEPTVTDEPAAVAPVDETARRVVRPLETTMDAGEPSPPSMRSLDVRLLGGAVAGPTRDVTAGLSLAAAFTSGPWGAVIDLGMESPRSAAAGDATIEVWTQWISAGARLVAKTQRLSFDGSLGVRAWLISASAHNVDSPQPISLLAPGGVVSAGASLQLFSPLRARLEVSVSTRFTTERFDLAGYGTALTLLPVQGSVTLGLEWRALETLVP